MMTMRLAALALLAAVTAGISTLPARAQEQELKVGVVGTTSDPGIAAYAASKHAVIGLMRTVAKEAAPRGIRVNVVAPGPIENEFQRNVETGLSRAIGRDAKQFLDGLIPLGRHGRADEIGRLVLYLASGQSSFSTGGVFMADGGMSI